MNKPTTLRARARRQAHSFVELLWHELPTQFIDDLDLAQFNFELHLIGFDVVVGEEELSGFELLTFARRRAEWL